jgi:hypothetical protein
MSKPTLRVPQDFLRGAIIAVGFAVMVVGISKIYGPAGWIAAGALIVLAMVLPIW